MIINFKKISYYFIFSILLFSIIFISGCTQNNSQKATEITGSITMSVEGYEDLAQFEKSEIPISEGMTVLDALYKTDFSVDISSGFVNSIDGLKNGSVEGYPYCGWMYYVNGELGTKSASEQILQDGDEIKWEFSLSFE